jgi:hypothetical protein
LFFVYFCWLDGSGDQRNLPFEVLHNQIQQLNSCSTLCLKVYCFCESVEVTTYHLQSSGASHEANIMPNEDILLF